MHRAHRQQRGDRQHASLRRLVADDQDAHAVAHCLFRRAAQALHGIGQRLAGQGAAALCRRFPRRRDCRRAEFRFAQRRQRDHLLRLQHRRRQLDQPRRLRHLHKQIGAATQQHAQTHHHLFAQRVDGRVGHLGKALLEVLEQRPRQVAHHCGRRVVAHRADWFVPLRHHRPQHHDHFLARIAEAKLPLHQCGLLRRITAVGGGSGSASLCRRLLCDSLVQVDQVVLHPAVIGTACGEVVRDLLVAHHHAQRRIYTHDLARPQPAFAHHTRLVICDCAGLAGADHQAVVQHDIARRAQAVAVEDGAHDAPVRIGDSRRPVPRLDQRAVVLVEGAALGRDLALRQPLPRLGDHHHERMAHVAPAAHKQFQLVVQLAAVAALPGDDRAQLGRMLAPHGVRKIALTRPHPILVALQRVDLAVVADHAEGLGALPCGEGIRAVALVKDGDSRGEVRIAQVRVEVRQLRGQHQALIDDGAAAEAGDVKALHIGGAPAVDDGLAHQVEHALEVVARIARFRRAPHQHLLHPRAARLSPAPQCAVDNGHGAEGQRLQLELGAYLADDAARMVAVLCVLAEQKELAHGQIAGRRRLYAYPLQFALEKLVGQLRQDAGPVTRLAVIRHRAAVRMIGERFQRHLQNGMAAPSLDVGHKTDAARIVFVARVIQPSCRGQLACLLERATGFLGDIYRFGFVHSCVLPHLTTSTGAPCHQPGQQ